MFSNQPKENRRRHCFFLHPSLYVVVALALSSTGFADPRSHRDRSSSVETDLFEGESVNEPGLISDEPVEFESFFGGQRLCFHRLTGDSRQRCIGDSPRGGNSALPHYSFGQGEFFLGPGFLCRDDMVGLDCWYLADAGVRSLESLVGSTPGKELIAVPLSNSSGVVLCRVDARKRLECLGLPDSAQKWKQKANPVWHEVAGTRIPEGARFFPSLGHLCWIATGEYSCIHFASAELTSKDLELSGPYDLENAAEVTSLTAWFCQLGPSGLNCRLKLTDGSLSSSSTATSESEWLGASGIAGAGSIVCANRLHRGPICSNVEKDLSQNLIPGNQIRDPNDAVRRFFIGDNGMICMHFESERFYCFTQNSGVAHEFPEGYQSASYAAVWFDSSITYICLEPRGRPTRCFQTSGGATEVQEFSSPLKARRDLPPVDLKTDASGRCTYSASQLSCVHWTAPEAIVREHLVGLKDRVIESVFTYLKLVCPLYGLPNGTRELRCWGDDPRSSDDLYQFLRGNTIPLDPSQHVALNEETMVVWSPESVKIVGKSLSAGLLPTMHGTQNIVIGRSSKGETFGAILDNYGINLWGAPPPWLTNVWEDRSWAAMKESGAVLDFILTSSQFCLLWEFLDGTRRTVRCAGDDEAAQKSIGPAGLRDVDSFISSGNAVCTSSPKGTICWGPRHSALAGKPLANP